MLRREGRSGGVVISVAVVAWLDYFWVVVG